MGYGVDITKKGKVGQFLCKHKSANWYKQKKSELGFSTISGEKHYRICMDCGKILDERFVEYEGMGFK